jgi:hypothetical protein
VSIRNRLRSFTAVAEEGNLTRGAERLLIAQPAVEADRFAKDAVRGNSCLRGRAPDWRSPNPAGARERVLALLADWGPDRTRCLAAIAESRSGTSRSSPPCLRRPWRLLVGHG